ncbi:hypothetical protein MTO96_040327 [Rhipicephalus appendiculatus]
MLSFLSYEVHGRDYCPYPHEKMYFCKYAGETYQQLCPGVTRTCVERGEITCICEPGYYREYFWRPCVPYIKCVEPKHKSIKILSSSETLYLTKASTGVFFTKLLKCFKSTYIGSGLSTYYRGLEYQKRTGTIFETEGVPLNDGGVDGVSIPHIAFEPTSSWEKVKGELYLDLVVNTNGRKKEYVIRTNRLRTPPPDVENEYTVLHADDKCIIIKVRPDAPGMTNCVFWTKESLVGQNLLECDFVFENYCSMPDNVIESVNDCQ